jgi:hypothetical protein
VNKLQEIISITKEIVPDTKLNARWVNGNLYAPTSEVFGIYQYHWMSVFNGSMNEYYSTLDSEQHHS